MKRNRWLTALAAVGIHMSIGSVYAWSVLTRPVMETMGLSLSLATWAFSIAILFLGLSAGFLGPLVERLGPSRSGMVSAVFFSTGLLGTAAAVQVMARLKNSNTFIRAALGQLVGREDAAGARADDNHVIIHGVPPISVHF